MPWRRRYHRLLIHPRAQFKLFAPFLVFMLAWTGVLVTIAWVYRGMIAQVAGPAQSLTPHDIANLQNLNKAMFKIFMIGSASSIGMAFLFWLAFSHKVFGPMVQIHRQIRRLAAGQTEGKVHLRDGDEFSHVAKAVNDLTEKLKQKAG